MPSATKLVIVESPAKAKTISRFLGRGYKVEASQGHIRDLPKSRLGVDVDDDFAMKYITIHGRGDVLARIRKEAKTASKIYLATDPDREGEAISWHLAQVLNIDLKDKCRVEFHEITKKAVMEAMAHPREIDMNKVDAQQARRALDRLVGYQISPLLWKKIKKGLSAGRVQSVATRMVVDRENEIQEFVPEEYWYITAKAVLAGKSAGSAVEMRLAMIDGKKAEIRSAEEAHAASALVRAGQYTVTQVKKNEKRKQPAPPFTTSSLQQEAGRKLNFTTQKTMQVVQGLYEGVEIGKEGAQGLVTYIRTDSTRLSEEAVAAARDYIRQEYGDRFLPPEPNVFKGRATAQDAHEAIRPTDVLRTPESIRSFLTNDQYKLYRLIYNRFLACQMAPAVYDTVTVDVTGGSVVLRCSGEKKAFAGFTSVYEESSDDEQTEKAAKIPDLKEKDRVELLDVNEEQHFTQPPQRYTEASLVRALEEKGIGRPSTYAPTITTILARGYITREKKRLYPTEMGYLVNQLMTDYFPKIVDIGFTADMEKELDTVSVGEEDWKQVLREFYPGFDKELKKAESEVEKIRLEDEVSDVPCEECGAMMVYKNGRFGRFLACPNFPECRNTRPVLKYIHVPCPVCGGELLEKISRKNRKFWGCERYPECDFVSWEQPVKDPCPRCGGYMIRKSNKQGVWYLCADKACGYKRLVEEDTEAGNA